MASLSSSASSATASSTAATDRKNDILQAALACFIEVGIEALSIDMVRARCGASVGSIYHHFGSKEGILAALFFEILDDQSRGFQKQLHRARDARAGVRGLVLGYVDWVLAQPERARFLFEARTVVAEGPRAADLSERARARNAALLAWFEPHRQNGALLDVPCDIVPSLVMGPAQSYCRAWLASQESMPSPRRYRDILADAAWRAVGEAVDQA